MHPRYPNVFKPIKLGPIEIPNRFFFSPHSVHLTVGSKPSNDYVAYKRERVQDGGCGLVFCGMVATERARVTQMTPHPKENIPAFRVLADGVHEAGGKIFGQLGSWWGVPGNWQSHSPPAPALTASANQFGSGDKSVSTHEMGTDDIRSVVAAFRQSTAHLREAGFDGVMLHASHGGIVEQFVSPYFNRRTDAYGGSFENRMRFIVECLHAVREGGRGEMAIGMRFNCDEVLPGGYDTSYARDVLKMLCDAGLLDYVDLDIAIEPNQFDIGIPPYFIEKHVYQPYVEAVRSAAGKVPVLSVLGRLTSMAYADAALASGLLDMVGATRALLAEPEFVKNAFNGNEDRSRTCISCNWCFGSSGDGAQGCAINPGSYRERYWGLDTFAPAARRSKVVVIGGGPGGLEAARVCALKGHDVTLMESRSRLGGGLALWASLPGREWLQNGVEWWEREVYRLGVDVRVGATATAADVLAGKPDAVIIATGARFSRGGHSWFREGDIPGHEQGFVYRPEDILVGGVRPGGKVVLLDGEGLNASTGIAELLARAGADVEYLTPRFSPVSARLVATLEATSIVKRLRAAGVKISPASYIRNIGDHAVTVFDVYSEEERTIEGVDAVILSTGRISSNELAIELAGQVTQLFTIGDALAVRPMATASFEGQKFARYVGEPDAPRTFTEAYFRRNPSEFTPTPADAQPSAVNRA